MPQWMAEMAAIEDNERMVAQGAPGLDDLDEKGAWREETDLIVIEALAMYAQYGQTNGFGDALDLPALVAGFEIEETPKADRPELTRLIQQIHSARLQVDAARKQKAKAGIRG